MSAADSATSKSGLRKTLGPWTLWGLGVGYVISGEYFGWNLGLPVGGTWGMLAATLFVTVMYVAFVLSYAELACAIPHAGGAFAYALRAMGPSWGLLAGVCQWIEFVFAPPAIALAIGAYFHVLIPAVPDVAFAVVAYVLITGINIWGVKQAARFELVVTTIAVIELIVFSRVVVPHATLANITKDAWPNGWTGAFAAIPFAIWFYLGIEGVANVAEEAEKPERDLVVGFALAMLTLVVLAVGVFFGAVGVAGWRAIVYPVPGAPPSDSPLPLAMAHAVAPTSPLYTMLVGIGLFGLVASFHGILLAAARATMALGQAGYAPSALGHVSRTTGTPVVALVLNMLIGIVAIFTGRTSDIITVSVFGALGLYALSMVALFALRRREPELVRPYRVHGYPWLPAAALVTALVCLAAMVVTSFVLAVAFAVTLTVAWFGLNARRRLARRAAD